ncbi:MULTISPECIES: metalloregulator ArsR/SmtB family transcription factor [Brevibacterium]|uniref:metalloregulator ArsR/SmtB family transcription factor n=1 Tax=Brevibacterium TaxID=1696 RepID=UPI000DEACA21|nr:MULTISPECIES: metalloregulator ArsR/SmtB family transcription factor [Brevibacterium]
MFDSFKAMADPARWRLVELLAERPRPVGVLAQLAGARQPQTTKHLQTLEAAGLVTAQRSAQRRIYALRPDAFRELAAELSRIADVSDRSNRETFDRYGQNLELERHAALQPGWADGRSFRFRRALAARPDIVWAHLTEQALLQQWWTPDDLRVSRLEFDARLGGRIVHEYRDVEDVDDADVVAGHAEGVVDLVDPEKRLAYRLSPVLPDGRAALTSHLDLRLSPAPIGTVLDVEFRITDSVVEGADFVAGIEIGFGQSLDRLAAILSAETAEGR